MLDIRSHFLRAHGLGHDPFSTAVAEYELYADGLSHLFSYLIPLNTLYTADRSPAAGPSLLTNTVIYGGVGSGKTALRFQTEALNRIARNRTLVTSYVFDDTAPDVSMAALIVQLAASLTTDLFIQLVEQFNPPLLPIEPAMVASVSALLWESSSIQPAIRDRILAVSAGDGADLSVCWPLLRRPAVVSVPLSSGLRDLIRDCLAVSPAVKANDQDDLLTRAMEVVKLWGYKHVVVLVDLGPNCNLTDDHTSARIQGLLQIIDRYRLSPLRFRLFMPSSFSPWLRKGLTAFDGDGAFEERHIFWTHTQLRAALAQRFRASGTRGEGLYTLADDQLAPMLDDIVIESAKGSPRRMIELVGALLNAHLMRGHTARPINRQTWRHLRHSWNGYLPPLPTSEFSHPSY